MARGSRPIRFEGMIDRAGVDVFETAALTGKAMGGA
jgi:hypothetical protein